MNRIAIAVGHGKSQSGGYDSGASANGFQEFKIAKEIAKYAQQYLNANYECKADLFNYNGDIYLMDRVAKFKTDAYNLLVEIHLNAGGGTGTEVYYSHVSENALGESAAQKISAQISADFSIRNRGAKIKLRDDGRDYFAIIRETKPHAVLVETLFIDSNDVYLVDTVTEQQKMGKSIAVGIANAMKLTSKQENTAPVQDIGKPDAEKIALLQKEYAVLQENKGKLMTENELLRQQNLALKKENDELSAANGKLTAELSELKNNPDSTGHLMTVGQALSVLLKAIKQAFV